MNPARPDDPRWPRASQWIADGTRVAQGQPEPPELGLLGVPAHLTSISPTRADTTPAAVRSALEKYSTWVESLGVDLRDLRVEDLGDVPEPDGPDGEQRVRESLRDWRGDLLMAVGGDNSVTYSVAGALRADGLVTLDAHHDLRDGESNGSPVRRLIADGLPGQRVVQVGIGDFTNSQEYAARARALGITIITRDEVEDQGMDQVMERALAIAAGGERGRVFVDLDVDVCDRSVVPACPASAPGGISALQLRKAARAAGRSPRVVGMDLTEVDASVDAADQRTVRLVALCVLEAAAGLHARLNSPV